MKKVYLFFTLLYSTLFCFKISFAHGDDCDVHSDNPVLQAEHCAVMELVHEEDATHIAINSGSWFTASTWDAMEIPPSGARVLIDSGVVVTYDQESTTSIFWIRVNGTLQFATNVNTKLRVNTIVVDAAGTMTVGTSAIPIASNNTAKIIFSDEGAIDTDWDPFLFSKGLISHGAFNVYGASKLSYASMNTDHTAGKTFLKLLETPTAWSVGDKLVLAGTNSSWLGISGDNSRYHDEELTITSISGKNVYFTNDGDGSNALKYTHKAPTGYGLKFHVANLSRNVIFETENWESLPFSERGHVMLMHNPNQNVYYASFIGLGRTDKLNFATDPAVDALGNYVSGEENVRGRYPLHIHRAGTNSTTIDPVNLKGNVVYTTPGWGIVNHSSNVVAEENIVYEFSGAAFVTEAGDEIGSFIKNLALKGVGNESLPNDSPVFSRILRSQNFDLGYEGDGYWMHSNNLELEGNIAASCKGKGFHYFADDDDIAASKKLKVPVSTIMSPVIAGSDDSVSAAIIPIRKNNNSVVYNSVEAMAFWTFMYNEDNIGGFSHSEDQPYAHNILSVIDNFKFWNLLNKGVDLTYSGQIHFRNGLMLGDLENHFDDDDWITDNEDDGIAVTSSIVTGQVVMENVTMKGWRKAAVVFRTDNSEGTDDLEANYRTSKIIGGVYENNYYNMYPEKGISTFGSNTFQFPKYFEISGSPVFSSITSNTAPVANFSYASAGGKTVQFNGGLSSDADQYVSTSGNGIAAYTWDFGDGTTGKGVDPVHYYSAGGTYSVNLTAYDCQGATNTFTKSLVVHNEKYPNTIKDSGFELYPLVQKTNITSTRDFVGIGWMENGDWLLQDDKATIINSIVPNKPLMQVNKNDRALQEEVEFSFQVKNVGTGAIGNTLQVEVIGINGEFVNTNIDMFGNFEKWPHNDMTFEQDVLLSEEFGMSNYDWTTFKRTVDFGTGYDYIAVSFYSYGVKNVWGDMQGVDNVCLPCDCSTPLDNFETQLTSTHVNLIWENVGSEEYQMEIKQQGGSWTDYTVENTSMEFSDLIPNKTYNWRVKAFCDGAYTNYSEIRKFITPVTGGACTTPTLTEVSLITSTTATLSWNQVPSVLQYQVQYKKTGTTTWTSVYTTNAFLAVTGLSPSTSYQWKVRSQCTEGWKQFTNNNSFATPYLKEGEISADEMDLDIYLYPNPASDVVNVSVNSNINETVTVQLIDLTGRTVLEESISLLYGASEFSIDVHAIARGAYILEISSTSGFSETTKLMIE